MGALGPKHVEMGPEGEQPKPPYHVLDNQDTALEFTDLVFIDPVSTGYSRAAPGENPAPVPRLRRRSRVGGRIHSLVSGSFPTLAFAQIPGGRKLRHHPRVRTLAIFTETTTAFI